MKKLGIALGGGGAKGLCHLAFLQVLDDLNIRPSIIAGTSIGSIIGGFYAAGLSVKEIEAIADGIDFGEFGKMLDFSWTSRSALLQGKGVEEFFAKNIPCRTFEELPIPLKVVGADFWERKEVVFDSGELIPAIRASMSLPGIFEPVRIGKSIVVDGGLVNPLPFDLIREECDVLAAIDVSGEKTYDGDDIEPGFFEILASSIQIASAAIVETKLEIAAPDIYIRPALKNIRVLEFDRADEILESVTEDVAQFKEQLLTHLDVG